MTTTIGSSQASLQDVSIVGTNEFYFTRFVSPPLFHTDIDANTWTYNFAAAQQQITAGFPVTGTDQPVHVHCYVWRPGTGLLVGTILDGNTASTVDESGAGAEVAHHVTFSGSAVSSMQDNDVLIFEVWFVCAGTAIGRTMDFYYDGTTENVTDNATVSNHASFLETPEDLAFEPTGELFLRSANESLTITSGTSIQVGRPVFESLTVDDAVVKMTRFFRSVVGESLTVEDAATGARHLPRNVAESLTVTDTDVARFYRAIKSLSESLTVSDDDDAIAGVRRVLCSVSESLNVNDVIVAAVRAVPRTITESLAINDVDVTRFISATRSVLESLTISAEDITVKAFQIFIRNVSESLTVTASVVRKACRVLPFLH